MVRPRFLALRTNAPAAAPRWGWAASGSEFVIRHDPATGRSTGKADGEPARIWDDPLDALRWIGSMDLADLPYRGGRWVGYLSYDLGRRFERLPAIPPDDLGMPLFAFALAGEAGRDPPVGPVEPPPLPAFVAPPAAVVMSTFGRAGYLAAVARAIEYVRAGDVFQVNLSQRLAVPWPRPSADLFHRLADLGGARYGALLDFGDFALVSNSPELFFRVDPLPDGRRRITSRPIKGTRPRRPGMDRELLASEKDKAELTMIVDLQRNDLGRICEVGTVKVTEPRMIEAHPTVYHGVATIEGILRPCVGFVDILRAMFPCGSVTGCPKVRAMEVIDELEPVARGPYCGAIGWVGADGAMEFNVAIRTTVVKDGLAYVPVGGGIVADSDPAAEYEETLTKAAATLAALGVSVNDLRLP
ncbi:MAG: pabB [Phycisphaerales bacterium]|nr:pabB [Phycisphaerales bacterium]